MPLNIPNVPTHLEGMKQGADIGKSILEGFLNKKKLEQEAMANQNLNDYRMGQLDIEKQMMPGKMALDKAHANYYGAQADPELLRSKIDSENALANQRNLMAGAGSVQAKDIMSFRRELMQSNPGMTMEQAKEISDAYLNGEENLPNGEPLPPIGGGAASIADKILGRRTTAGAANQALGAAQASAEETVLKKYIDEGLKPYGDTVMGVSLPQIMDTMSNSKESQQRLGKYIAAQALNYELAQLRNRIAAGQPGITATKELMEESKQFIHAKYPRLGAAARKEASDTIEKALKEGLAARRKTGVGMRTAFKKEPAQESTEEHSESPSSNVKQWKIVDGQLVEA